jgi:hypothetical protein
MKAPGRAHTTATASASLGQIDVVVGRSNPTVAPSVRLMSVAVQGPPFRVTHAVITDPQVSVAAASAGSGRAGTASSGPPIKDDSHNFQYVELVPPV